MYLVDCIYLRKHKSHQLLLSSKINNNIFLYKITDMALLYSFRNPLSASLWNVLDNSSVLGIFIFNGIWTALKCLLRCVCRPKILSQNLHLKFLIPWWTVSTWISLSLFWEKQLPQVSHSWGLMRSWTILMCFFK